MPFRPTALLLAATSAVLGPGFAAEPPTPSAAAKEYDVVVYGGTSAGVIAAVQAKRMGKTAVIVGPDVHLGGLSSGGLGWTDSGRKDTIGGLARDFYHRVWRHYQTPEAWRQQTRESYGNKGQGTPAIDGDARTMWIFEPHVAEAVFDGLVKEYDIPVFRDEWLDRAKGVKKDGGRIASITTLSGKTFRGKMFVDATYEGDLMAAAGVTYTVGREGNDVYGEQLNGVEAKRAHSHQFTKPVDPYNTPGDPSSGLLPRIHAGGPGEEGKGDKRVQAYCFRMCLTNKPENRVPFPKPANYDPRQYELLARYLDTGWREFWNKFDPIPNAKTDTNNHGAFSTDNIGMNYDYPDASYERRKEIIQEHRDYQTGLMWFLTHDPRAPEDMRKKMSEWGLAKDEFTDNGNWPHQIYVREARRMVADYVNTEHDCKREVVCPDSVGLGSYNMDSHNVQRYVDEHGHARNEGDIQVSPGGSYAISYRAIVPKAGEVQNLFVPVCLSASHIAFGSIRMEPVFMILGQSAGTAAAIAIDEKIPVQQVDYARLRERLVKDGQVLDPQGNAGGGGGGVSAKSLPGVVVDDAAAKFAGDWQEGHTVGPWVGAGYRHDGDAGKGEKSATFAAPLKPGRYEVRLAYSPNPNRATNVPVTVTHAGGQETVAVDERKPPKDAPFVSLGTFEFGSEGTVRIDTRGTNGHVIADAVQFLPAK